MKRIGRIDSLLIKTLKQLRLQKGLSQNQLAEALEAAQSFVSKYESGERNLSFSEVWEIAQILDTTPEKIIELIKHDSGELNETQS